MDKEIRAALSRYSKTLCSLIRLSRAFGAGSVKAVRIYNKAKEKGVPCGDAEALFGAGIIDSNDKLRISAVTAEDVGTILCDCEREGISVLGINEPRYPEALRNISAPPLVLYIKGELPDTENNPAFCIVGPREISEFGAKAAYSLARRLARAGFVIVSGGAKGGDKNAHKGALSVGGKTVGVLACGIACNYLPENKGLREEISRNGCLVSEYPPYVKPTNYSFPVRNRLLSGLSLGVALVEADSSSGGLITARHANDQGRDVFVMPGNPTLERYKGSNELLRDGAILLTSAKDIIEEYADKFPDVIDIERAYAPLERAEEGSKAGTQEKLQKKLKVTLSKEAEIVYNNLDRQKFTVDDLLGLGLSVDELLSALTELEMEQLIVAMPGGMYAVCK